MVVLGLLAMVFVLGMGGPEEKLRELPDSLYFMEYNPQRLPASPANDLVKLGHDIIRNTSRYLGPDQEDTTKIYAGNRLACTNCHLDAGTRPFAVPLIGVVKRFPQYRGREDKIGTIEERVNGCMERSMNGQPLPAEGREMRAMIAYMEWLGRYTQEDGKIAGRGFVELGIPERAVDLEHGNSIFRTHCTSCHGDDGQGQRSPDGIGYTYPPLWGKDSYNNGAGLTRVLTAAQFIKGNMPLGTTYDQPVLTDAEAYDVAGFINQQQRPDKSNREADFPDLVKKPVSTPYGPYADPFTAAQHELGPFQPIMEYYKKEFNLIKSK
jgi:thiosulfate dehydrogenase